MAYKLDTEVLYQGTTPQGIIRNPETPAIYPASAYILDDMEDYVFADKGGRYYYNTLQTGMNLVQQSPSWRRERRL